MNQLTSNSKKFIIKCQNRIEKLFENYQIENFKETINTEILNSNKEILEGIVTRYEEQSKNWKSIIDDIYKNNKDDFIKNLKEYIYFLSDVSHLLIEISTKMNNLIKNKLVNHCASILDLSKSKIDFVDNYVKFIRDCQPDINDLIQDILLKKKDFKEKYNNIQLCLQNVDEIVTCFKSLRASINKLYYLIPELVDEEDKFVETLYKEIDDINTSINKCNDELFNNNNLVKSYEIRSQNYKQNIKILLKNKKSLKRKLWITQNSLQTIYNRTQELDKIALTRSYELSNAKKNLNELEILKKYPNKRLKIPNYKLSMDLTSARLEQKEILNKKYKNEDNINALKRQNGRLRKLENLVTEKINELDNKLKTIKKMSHKIQLDIKELNEKNQEIIENLSMLKIKQNDLVMINDKKKNYRKPKNNENIKPSIKKSPRVIYEAIEIVKNNISDSQDWQTLYLNLPFIPERQQEQRKNDIDILDRSFAKNDYILEEQIKGMFEKWLQFFHLASVEHLIEGLNQSNMSKISDKVKNMMINDENPELTN